MTDKEIWTLAGRYGEWLNGEVIQITDENLIKLVSAIEKAEREACATAIEALEEILKTEPCVGMNLNAKPNSPNAVEWNVHTIARDALTKSKG